MNEIAAKRRANLLGAEIEIEGPPRPTVEQMLMQVKLAVERIKIPAPEKIDMQQLVAVLASAIARGKAPPPSYDFEVTQRDEKGFIKHGILTPITKD